MPDDRPEQCDPSVELEETTQSLGTESPQAVPVANRFAIRESWQVPLVLLSITLILVAAWYRSTPDLSDTLRAGIKQVRKSIAAGDLDLAAVELRNIGTRIEPGETSLMAEYHATVGDWRVTRVGKVTSASPEEAAAITTAYDRAVADGWTLQPQQSVAIAEAYIADARMTAAEAQLDLVETVSNVELEARVIAARRTLAQRRIETMAETGEELSAILEAVDAYIALEPGPASEAWAVAFRARQRVLNGQVAGLPERLSLDMRRLEPIDDGTIDWSALHTLLGEAYRADNRLVPAEERFLFALDRLEAGDDVAGIALRNLGEMRLADGRAADAERFFRKAVELPGALVDDALASEIGLGLAIARQGNHAEAMRILGLALQRLVPEDVAHRLSLSEGLRAEGMAAILASAGKPESEATALAEAALGYAGLAARTTNDDEGRKEALKQKALAHETMAEALLDSLLDGRDPRDVPEETIPFTLRVQVNQHLVKAGNAYLELDRLATTDDGEAAGVILWNAATAFDRGGWRDQAVALYTRYLEDRPIDDDRRGEAMFRVALAHHAALETGLAAEWYRRLLRDGENISQDSARSNFITRAKVGLARCLASGGHGNAEELVEAEGHLRDIVDGRELVGPDAPEYREAMFQLGRVLADRRQWTEAVEVMETALTRYENDPRVPEYAARVGLCWREIASLATGRMEASPLSPGRRNEVAEARTEALEHAVARLEQAIVGLDSTDRPALDPFEAELLRAAYLRRADSAAELGSHAEAMEFYGATERRFGEEPTALEALVRMSNLAQRTGDEAAARAATSRVRVLLRRVSPDRLDGPDLLGGIGTDALEKWIALQPPGGLD
ncbi:MAG: tetratricopeptide repeat protein [Phycisphaerales bacterium]|nr:tetratricopeptide repeat protein [Phycisphaerales bacterium]